MRSACATLTVLALLILAMPLAAGKSAASVAVDLTLPDHFSLSEATLILGHIEMTGASFSHARFVNAHSGHLDGGNLTVCPVRLGGRSGSALETILSTLSQGCLDGQTFQDAQLRFGRGTSLAFNGTLGLTAMPAASVLVPFVDDERTVAVLLSDDGVTIAPADGLFRFAPTTPRSSIAVLTSAGTSYFNGTDYAVVASSPGLWLAAGGMTASLDLHLDVAVTPATNGTLEQALRPFDLLDLEEAALGPDAREPRGNVSGLFREFGRVPAFVDGALEGRLNGTIGSLGLDGGLALVRASRLDLQEENGHLVGNATPLIIIAPQGVALDGVHTVGPPWLWGLVFWIAAVVILAARRAAPVRTWFHRIVWLVAAALMAWIADATVLRPALGASALSEIGQHASGGPILALATFTVVLVLAAYFLLALPLRSVLGRLMPTRFLLLAEGVLALAWAILPFFFAASFFALAYVFARL